MRTLDESPLYWASFERMHLSSFGAQFPCLVLGKIVTTRLKRQRSNLMIRCSATTARCFFTTCEAQIHGRCRTQMPVFGQRDVCMSPPLIFTPRSSPHMTTFKSQKSLP